MGIDQDTYLDAAVEGDCLRLRKRPAARPLGAGDPIWNLVGAGKGGEGDVSARRDHYLAESEREEWRSS